MITQGVIVANPSGMLSRPATHNTKGFGGNLCLFAAATLCRTLDRFRNVGNRRRIDADGAPEKQLCVFPRAPDLYENRAARGVRRLLNDPVFQDRTFAAEGKASAEKSDVCRKRERNQNKHCQSFP